MTPPRIRIVPLFSAAPNSLEDLINHEEANLDPDWTYKLKQIVHTERGNLLLVFELDQRKQDA